MDGMAFLLPRAQSATASPNCTTTMTPPSISRMRGCMGAPELDVFRIRKLSDPLCPSLQEDVRFDMGQL